MAVAYFVRISACTYDPNTEQLTSDMLYDGRGDATVDLLLSDAMAPALGLLPDGVIPPTAINGLAQLIVDSIAANPPTPDTVVYGGNAAFLAART